MLVSDKFLRYSRSLQSTFIAEKPMNNSEKESSATLRIIAITLVTVLALAFAGYGVFLALHGFGNGQTRFTLFGQEFRSGSVALAAIFMSVVLVVILFKAIVRAAHTDTNTKPWFRFNTTDKVTTKGKNAPGVVSGDYQIGGEPGISSAPPSAIFEKTQIGHITTGGDNSPGVVMGNYTVQITQQMKEESKAKAKKVWKEIGQAAFPGMSLSPAIHANFLQCMLIALHRAFRDKAFVRFVALIFTAQEIRAGQTVNLFKIVCPYDRFCVVLQTMGRKIIEQSIAMRSLEPSERESQKAGIQKEFADELRQLEAEFGLFYSSTMFSEEPTPFKFTYDGSAKRISIVRLEQSTDMSRYDEGLTTTDGALRFMAAVSSSEVVIVHFEDVPSGASNFRLLASILDKEVEFSRLRINVDDPEEWDYKNAAFDQEAQLKGS